MRPCGHYGITSGLPVIREQSIIFRTPFSKRQRKRSISSIRKLLRQSHCSKQGTVASITCYLSVYRPRSSPETSLFYLGFPEGSMHGKVMALLTVI